MGKGGLTAVTAAITTKREDLPAPTAMAADTLFARLVTGQEKLKHPQEICQDFNIF
jgi:hypothetical protein